MFKNHYFCDLAFWIWKKADLGEDAGDDGEDEYDDDDQDHDDDADVHDDKKEPAMLPILMILAMPKCVCIRRFFGRPVALLAGWLVGMLACPKHGGGVLARRGLDIYPPQRYPPQR